MKVKVISLASSLERRTSLSLLLGDTRFSFFNAEMVNNEHWIYTFYNKNKTQQYKGYQLTTPELGCFASHISLWKECVENDETLLILEDNIEIYGLLSEQLLNIENLAIEHGVIKLGNVFKRTFKKIQHIDGKYQLVSNLKGACGTSAYAISPQAAKLYLNKINDFFEPVDDFMDNEWRTNQTIYSYNPELISRSKTKSTIGKRKIKNNISLLNRMTVELYRVYKQIMQYIYNLRFK